jgi:hypothetical protein
MACIGGGGGGGGGGCVMEPLGRPVGLSVSLTMGGDRKGGRIGCASVCSELFEVAGI